ncbi:MAG: GNAT family N-acetyltransferase [Zetaproteobacteria bacterium CG12_big_fil_rev_8_21_14_0_65_54_13]|nr:MAG: GNAT family N-acetyltransferase [Zetaproteobacteria bacterium CG12_big_fil_rev_8_21_14_0_65_54_13]PIX55498.1 MAG: GNAT family N-acetyltransferase [Zetaproteobacteria bacterium CG_4_10_14_3_um_filter_54_28]PJA30790.1 MAG: GNAT family N-acetyltransferase [Zetaproteobacteria bacterium CG_4_9_14_3_um_filter_54_145]
MSHRISIRNAGVDDVEAIYALLQPFVVKNIILARDRDNIYQHLQEFLVADYDGELCGVVAVHIYGENLAEVRSLVVSPAYQKHGIGRLLVEGCEQWLAALGVARVFALTYVTAFFERMGYAVVSRESLPHKVWTVCVHCARFADCDEVAVEKRLSDAPIKPMRISPIIEINKA